MRTKKPLPLSVTRTVTESTHRRFVWAFLLLPLFFLGWSVENGFGAPPTLVKDVNPLAYTTTGICSGNEADPSTVVRINSQIFFCGNTVEDGEEL